MSGPIDQNQTYRYRFPVKNSSGVLVNAGTVTVVITLPDGTTTSPTVVNSGTGLYDIAYTTSQVGLHTVRATATGGVLGSEVDVWEDIFVAEQPGLAFISVDEAYQHLRAANFSDVDREQLRWLCLVASEAVEGDLGRKIARRTIIETHDGGSSSLSLRYTPVISVTSIVSSGTALVANTDYVADLSAGIIWRGTSRYGWTFADGAQTVVVTYVAGYTNPPRIARKVALNAVQGMWQTSQQASHPLINEDVASEFVAASVEGLTPIELRSYQRLRAPGMA